jgi:hypothetical protein
VSNVVYKPQLEKGSVATSFVKGDATGQVWIPTGTSSTVAFNALKKNAIQVYPLTAKQYTGGAWVNKTAKSYQNGVWTDLLEYLYSPGDEWENITGGWISEGKKYSSSATTAAREATITRRVDSIQIGPFSQASAGTFRCKNPVDLSEYSKIKVTGTFYSSSGSDNNLGFYLWSSIGTYYETNAVVKKYVGPETTLKTMEVDVSGLTGAYYIGFIYNTAVNGLQSYVKMITCELHR